MKTTKGDQSGSLTDTDSIEPLSILPGPGIFTTRNSIDNSYTISALAGIDNPVSIKSGPGIISSFDTTTNEYFIDTVHQLHDMIQNQFLWWDCQFQHHLILWNNPLYIYEK